MSAKITFLTRHYPPSPNINGESVCDMVKYLEDTYGIQSNVICMDRDFEGGGQKRKPEGQVYRIKPLYTGTNAIARFAGFLYDGYMLIKKALQFKETVIVCTTSPPILPFWASLFFNKKIKWSLWSLDLFPEGFNASGKIGQSNPFYQWVKKTTYKNAPSFLIALGPKQADHLYKEYNQKMPTLLLPCGVFFYQDKSNVQPDWWEEDKIFLGYCGNIGDPHNPDFIKAAIDQIDPQKHRLILALYGVKAPPLIEYAKGKPGVILVKSVPRNQLHFIDIHLVSLTKKWTHIAVPSKAVSAISMGSSILFCGHQDSDNWYMFRDSGWFIEENDQLFQAVAQFFKTLNKEEIIKKKRLTGDLYKQLQQNVLDSYKGVADVVNEPKVNHQ